MVKVKLVAFLIVIILPISIFAQKRINVQYLLVPGNSFILGQWKNYESFNYPQYGRKFTPSLDAGLSVEFNFKGKPGGKMAYDVMTSSGYYLADHISFNAGLLYSFCGQNYKDMKDGDVTWSRNLRLQYLKLPLKIIFVKGQEDKFQLIYSAGFYAAYLTNYIDKNTTLTNTNKIRTVTKGNSIITTSADGTVIKRYQLLDKPYEQFDYGMLLGIGIQKKVSRDLFLQFILTGQLGFPDIKNTSAQYFDGNDQKSYFGINSSPTHENASLGMMVALKKTFEWTPKPKEARKRWRIFRLKN